MDCSRPPSIGRFTTLIHRGSDPTRYRRATSLPELGERGDFSCWLKAVFHGKAASPRHQSDAAKSQRIRALFPRKGHRSLPNGQAIVLICCTAQRTCEILVTARPDDWLLPGASTYLASFNTGPKRVGVRLPRFEASRNGAAQQTSLLYGL